MKVISLLNNISEVIDSIKNVKAIELLESVRRKQRIYNSEIEVNSQLIKIDKSSFLLMNDDRLIIKDIHLMIIDEYITIEFDTGEIVDYDYYGKAYFSLDKTSKFYKRRLTRYDIKQIV